jgi:hypothetical protein
MALRREDLAAGRRDAPNRDREWRRVSSAIGARRGLNARRADGIKADRVGRGDSRYEYLTRSYD